MHSKKDVVLKGGTLNFIQTETIPATALVEAAGLQSPQCEAITAVYRKQNKIAIMNKGPTEVVIRKGEQVAEARLMKDKKPDRNPEERMKGIEEQSEQDRLTDLVTQLKLEENE